MLLQEYRYMDATWFIVTTFIIYIVAKLTTHRYISSSSQLPPGPLSLPILGSLTWIINPVSDVVSIVRHMKARYGPIFTLTIGPQPFIVINDRSLAHRALIQHGAIFADRPAPSPTSKILNRTQLAITTLPYGPTWRHLRLNFIRGVLNPSKVGTHSSSRRQVLSELLIRLHRIEHHSVRLIDHFQFAVFHLLMLMCFGENLSEEQVKDLESIQRQLISFTLSKALNLCPTSISKILFRKRWGTLVQLCVDQEKLMIPLIRARFKSKQKGEYESAAYVDSLMNLQLPEENNRMLEEWEIVSLCSEFLTAGTDTTSTALQWIMANLVKYPEIQAKLYNEIIGVVGFPPPIPADCEHLKKVLDEEDILKMPYLKSVVFESLRRHPPSHFVVPHKVTKDVELDGYVIPTSAVVNFVVGDIGCDPTIWEDPMKFEPERFLDERASFDLTGNREIKMIPFGAGRRSCPASSLALQHLEYFVANLIFYFEWKLDQNKKVDLTEKLEFTTVMKNPLCARISPRNYC